MAFGEPFSALNLLKSSLSVENSLQKIATFYSKMGLIEHTLKSDLQWEYEAQYIFHLLLNSFGINKSA